jgi:pyruvate,water dikinase
MALVHYDRVTDPDDKAAIDELTKGYPRRTDYFVDKLARSLGRIAATVYPNPVIVRMSDLKTNEYANLIGGAAFEPKEENPMIGFRYS